MRLILLTFILFTEFTGYAQTQQDTSFFKIEKMGNVVFLEPKLPQAPADTSRDSNGSIIEYEEYEEYVETFLAQVRQIAQELGIRDTLKNEKVELDIFFDEQGTVFYCDFFFHSTESFSKFDLKKLEELVKRVLTLKVDMKYLPIYYEILHNSGFQNFTYGILTCWFD